MSENLLPPSVANSLGQVGGVEAILSTLMGANDSGIRAIGVSGFRVLGFRVEVHGCKVSGFRVVGLILMDPDPQV